MKLLCWLVGWHRLAPANCGYRCRTCGVRCNQYGAAHKAKAGVNPPPTYRRPTPPPPPPPPPPKRRAVELGRLRVSPSGDFMGVHWNHPVSLTNGQPIYTTSPPSPVAKNLDFQTRVALLVGADEEDQDDIISHIQAHLGNRFEPQTAREESNGL